MKINDNGITREMTPEEIAEHERMAAEMPTPEPTAEERIKELEEAPRAYIIGGDGMKPEMRAKIIAFNRQRAQDAEKANDLMTLLSALPPGQVRQLLKDETCAKILEKYGITREDG